MLLIPKLRFPDYNNQKEWDAKSMETIFTIRNGYTPSKANPRFWKNGNIPWFRMEDIRLNGHILSDSIQHVTPEAIKGKGLFPAYSIIVATTATIGEHALIIVDSLANQRFTFLTKRKSFEKVIDMLYFHYYMFRVDDWCKKNTNSGGLLSVNMSAFKQLMIPYPIRLSEQQKIAKCLSSIDSYISSINEKVDQLKAHKTSLLQKLFPQNGKNVPEYRFPEFNTEWKNVALGDVLVERREHSTITNDLPQLSFTIEEGVIYPNNKKTNKRDFLINDKDNKKYLVTYIDDIIYNPANVIYGAIHKNSLCNGVVSPIYKIFSTSQDASFMEYIVRMPEFIQKMSTYMEGTVLKLRTLKPESFLKMEVFIAPSLAEQRKIAECLSSIDKTIEYYRQKSVILEQHKKGIMQQLFPE